MEIRKKDLKQRQYCFQRNALCIQKDGMISITQILRARNDRVDMRWVEYFQKWKEKNIGRAIKKIVSFALSIPGSNASCERTFAVLGHLWRKESNKLTTNLVKAELQVNYNFHLSCKEFHELIEFLMKNSRILSAPRIQKKYKLILKKVIYFIIIHPVGYIRKNFIRNL